MGDVLIGDELGGFLPATASCAGAWFLSILNADHGRGFGALVGVGSVKPGGLPLMEGGGELLCRCV